MNDSLFRTTDRFEGTIDEVLPRLSQDLDHHIIRNETLFDDLPDEIEISLACGRETNFDLFVTHLDQEIEHGELS